MKMLPFIHSNFKRHIKVPNAFVLRTLMVIFVAWICIQCKSNSLDEIEQLIRIGEVLPVSTSENITLIQSDSGEIKAWVHAPIIDSYKEVNEMPYDLFSKGLIAHFMDTLGEVETTVTSEYAIYYPRKNTIILTKNVVVTNIDGDRLNSEYLEWNSNMKKIFSNDFVKITTASEIIYGDGFEADQEFTYYKIKNIKGIISTQDEDL